MQAKRSLRMQVEGSKAYVLGGIVDRVAQRRLHPHATLLAAKQDGVKVYRLPIDRYIKLVYNLYNGLCFENWEKMRHSWIFLKKTFHELFFVDMNFWFFCNNGGSGALFIWHLCKTLRRSVLGFVLMKVLHDFKVHYTTLDDHFQTLDKKKFIGHMNKRFWNHFLQVEIRFKKHDIACSHIHSIQCIWILW